MTDLPTDSVGPSPRQDEAVPPIYVCGGKRLNFTREDHYDHRKVSDTFMGEGKCEGTYPSASWDELCAFATLIVNHPAYRPLTTIPGAAQQPFIENAPTFDDQASHGVDRSGDA